VIMNDGSDDDVIMDWTVSCVRAMAVNVHRAASEDGINYTLALA